MTRRTASISTQHLSKRYARSSAPALDDLSIEIFPGEVYGFLGPNGAGKSTTIKLLLNLLQPSHGSATLLGQDCVRDSVTIKQHVGYLAGDTALYGTMTGRQFLDYMSSLQPSSDQAYRHELEKRFAANTDKKLSTLSRGNRQKIAIIQAVMHRPEILILDEPTSGLDPLMQEVFFDVINDAKSAGATVFLSSHIMSEVQKICDRVGIIRSGKLVGEYTIAELSQNVAQRFEITFHGKIPTKKELDAIPGLQTTQRDKTTLHVHMDGSLSPLFSLLARYDVRQIDAQNLDLEATFKHFYENEESH